MAALNASVEAVLAHAPGVAIIEGEAGIGKTTLVERFLAGRPAVRVLRASGEESESEAPFAVADQLLRSADAEHVDVLGADSHLTVGMELLERLANVPHDCATVVVVDDAQIADVESVRALLFCARRLARSATLFILVVRGRAAESLPEGWLKLAEGAITRVGALTVDETRALGTAVGVPLTVHAAKRLNEHTQGNPLHLRAVLRELTPTGSCLHDLRPLPVPRQYARVIAGRMDQCTPDVSALLEAASVLGRRAPLHSVLALVDLVDPLVSVDRAVATGLIELAATDDGNWLVFSHPLTRAAVHDSLPAARRSALHIAAAEIASEPDVALHHRVEAAALPDDALRAELEAASRADMARGAWASAVRHLLAASRTTNQAPDRERLVLDAIEALLYSGDGGTARRLADGTRIASGPHRDSVWAFFAMFADDLGTAELLLERAWEVQGLSSQLASTVAQRRAFLAASRLRGAEAIEWVERAVKIAPDEDVTALLSAPSLAIGLGLEGRIDEAHAALDRWLEDPATLDMASGFALLAIKARLLEAHGDIDAATTQFARSAELAMADNLPIIASLSFAGLARTQYRAGAWDDALVSAERAVALAIESEDRWLIAHALWSAAFVPSARGDHSRVETLRAGLAAEPAMFERHTALQALFAAQLAASCRRPAEVLDRLAPLVALDADYTSLPWQHLQAEALIDAGRLAAAAQFITEAEQLASERRHPLLAARLASARAKLALARHEPGAATEWFAEARARIEPLRMPYEQALIELAHAELLRREGKRRAASDLLMAAREAFARLAALPALERCERELTACGLTQTARTTTEETGLFTPQETAVTRLVVSGMTNREVAKDLRLSIKTVEFHLSNVYLKAGVRSRSELRRRAREHDLDL